MAEALYRKYRPQTFADVVGQEHIERTIRHAIEREQLAHAYLFCGPRGTGKTTTARLLAKALLCEHGPTAQPDGTCSACVEIAEGLHPDVYELDAASRTGVENVREEIISRVQFAPTQGRYKVYIIDEVHMLSTAAFNALLKTLEEPPSHVIFILCTTDPQKVPETIHSRCQRFDFKRIAPEDIVGRLAYVCDSEHVEYEQEALEIVAIRAEGGLRNALTSLEQLIAFGEGSVTLAAAESMLGSLDSEDLFKIMQAIGKRDAAACFVWTAQFIEDGGDLAHFGRDLAAHVRDLYVFSLAGADMALESIASQRKQLEKEKEYFGPDRLSYLLIILGELNKELKTATNPRLMFEIALTKMVRPESDITLASLAERVETLERRMASQMHSTVVASVASPALSPVNKVVVEQNISQKPAIAQVENLPDFEKTQTAAKLEIENKQVKAPVVTNAEAMHEKPAMLQNPVSSSEVQQEIKPAAETTPALPTETLKDNECSIPFKNIQDLRVYYAGIEIPRGVLKGLHQPAALQRLWQATLQAVRKTKPAYGVMFLNVKVEYNDSVGCLIVEFPSSNEFIYKSACKAEVVETLASCLAQSATSPVPFAFHIAVSKKQEPQVNTEPIQNQQVPVFTAPKPTVKEEPVSNAGSSEPGVSSAEDMPPFEVHDAEVEQARHFDDGEQEVFSSAEPDNFDTENQVPLDVYNVRENTSFEGSQFSPNEEITASRSLGNDGFDKSRNTINSEPLVEEESGKIVVIDPVPIRKGSKKTKPLPIEGKTAEEIYQQRFKKKPKQAENRKERSQENEGEHVSYNRVNAPITEQKPVVLPEGFTPPNFTHKVVEKKDDRFENAPDKDQLDEWLATSFGENLSFKSL